DRVYVFTKNSSQKFSRTAVIPLDHGKGNGLLSNAPAPLNADAPKPMTAGIAVTATGAVAVVANLYNDSISIIDLKTRKKTNELDLRPGINDKTKTGVPGGEYPFWIAIEGDSKAYVSSSRDREIVVVQLGQSVSVAKRIPLPGQPNRILLNRAQDRLFVAMDNADAVAVIGTQDDRIITSFNVTAPSAIVQGAGFPKGANPNSLALSPDEQTLYVTDGGTNAIAVVKLEASGSGSVAA